VHIRGPDSLTATPAATVAAKPTLVLAVISMKTQADAIHPIKSVAA
jgi:hypothetical protein